MPQPTLRPLSKLRVWDAIWTRGGHTSSRLPIYFDRDGEAVPALCVLGRFICVTKGMRVADPDAATAREEDAP
jgi:hypothetical protein